LRADGMPVSVFDPATQQWVSGNFDSNPDAPVKSESDAAVTAAAGALPAPCSVAVRVCSQTDP
jgi:hypothetical protein